MRQLHYTLTCLPLRAKLWKTGTYVSGLGMGLEFHFYIHSLENMKVSEGINTWQLNVTHQ